MENVMIDSKRPTLQKNLSTYRTCFPHTESRVYLNHAALSPLHNRSLQAIQRYQFTRTYENVEYWPNMPEDKARFKELIGQLINVNPDYVAFTENTSMGLNWLTRGLSWQAGDRVLLNDFEFPSNVYPFLHLESQGVAIDYVKHRNGRIALEDIAAQIRPETRVLSISYVQFLNGFKCDLKEIGQLCRENDIIFCVDGIQGIGAVQLDAEDCMIDFLACGGQKWLMWPLGTAFMYIAPRIFDDINPMAPGWLSVDDSWEFFDYDLKYLPTAERFEPGMVNAAGIAGAIASLEMFLEAGPKNIEETIYRITDYLIDRLQEHEYYIYTPLERKYRAGIVSFHHSNAEALAVYLNEKGVHVSVRNGFIRVAPHFYNTEEDIDCLMELMITFDHAR